MLTDEEIQSVYSEFLDMKGSAMEFARRIERAVLAKAIAQQERIHKEWSELWSPIDEAVRPLTQIGESVAAKALELINTAKAMQEQEPVAYIHVDTETGYTLYDNRIDDLMDGRHPVYICPIPDQQSNK